MKLSKFIFFLFLSIAIHAPINAAVILENEYLLIQLNDQGTLMFVDKSNGVSWGSNFVGWVNLSDGRQREKIPLETSEFNANVHGKEMLLHFNGISGGHLEDDSFEMHAKLSLNERQFEIEIIELKTKLLLEDMEYPAHLLTVKSGIENAYITVPHLQGILLPSRYDAGFMRFGQNIWDLIADQEKWWAFESGNLNMPWFGASIGNSHVLATMMTSSDCVLHLIGNAVVGQEGFTVNARQGQVPGTRMSSLSPIWKASKQQLAYARRMRIELVQNGYVGMAKRYKEYAKASGRYVTLQEKIARNPQYEKIIGAPDIKIYCYTNRLDNPYYKAWSEPVLTGYSRVNTTFDQVVEIANDLESMGLEKALILLAGWNRMGYDREHVDMRPPAEPAGGIDGLQRACLAVKNKGYLFALHDNYDDFYPDAPTYDEKYILRDQDGSLHQGGVWDGGPCHITCPATRMELLNRNMALVQASIPLNAYYFDVVTNTSHYECYDGRHPITRKGDLEHRLALLDNIVQRGLVIGGERGTDWAMPVVAFCEGLSGGGADYHRGVVYRIGINIPLFYLVYRECVVGYWQHGTPFGREDHANHVLLDLLQGQPSSWSIVYNQWDDLKPLLKETYDLLGRFHEKTAFQPMTDHEILSSDFHVQKSTFGDGAQVWVNYGITTYRDDNVTLPPKGFILNVPGEENKKGTVSRKIKYLSE